MFSLRLSIFQRNFDNLLPIYIYTHITNFGWFIFTFSNILFFFSSSTYRFYRSMFTFTKSNCRDFVAKMSGSQFIRPQFTGLSSLSAGVLSQAASGAKNSSVFKDALQLVWSVLLEKAIDNAVKDYHKRLPAAGMCVGQRWTFLPHCM